jgi:hypothetical protein
MTQNPILRRSLALAIQILEDMPGGLQPISDIADMRAIRREQRARRFDYGSSRDHRTRLSNTAGPNRRF